MLKRVAVVMSIGLVLGGCQTTATQSEPVSSTLAPMSERQSKVGDVWRYQDENGATQETEVVAVNGEEISFKGSDGCTWTRGTSFFAPTLRWSGCGSDGDGSQKIEQRQAMADIRVGATASWDFEGSNNKGSDWRSTRNCSVPAEERVTVPAGTFDSYKVVCEDRWRTRTWYLSPELGVPVKFVSQRKRSGETERSEMVSWSPASG